MMNIFGGIKQQNKEIAQSDFLNHNFIIEAEQKQMRLILLSLLKKIGVIKYNNNIRNHNKIGGYI